MEISLGTCPEKQISCPACLIVATTRFLVKSGVKVNALSLNAGSTAARLATSVFMLWVSDAKSYKPSGIVMEWYVFAACVWDQYSSGVKPDKLLVCVVLSGPGGAA